MPELLLELFSEEIPARLQRRAAEDLKKAVTNALVENGLTYESAGSFVTPRRLTLSITGIPLASPDTKEERKGPKVGAPQPAIDGFLRAAGLSTIEEATIQADPKKGDFYIAHTEKKGAPAEKLLQEILPKVILGFPWGKPMRWGAGRMQWVRPLRAITATFGSETEDPTLIEFTVGDVKSSNITYGHRFMAPAPIKVRRFSDYAQSLDNAKVVLDIDRRKAIIEADANTLAFAQGLEVIADAGLLEEVAGLVEYPVVMMGSFDESFLAVPEEAIIATIRANQKCFCVRDTKTGALANKFIIISNLVAEDGGTTIIAGNERVIRARLSDAKFFYEQDLAKPLAHNLPKLQDVVFHAKLGTQFARVERITALAAKIAPLVGANIDDVTRAAELSKADLPTGMVGEFPELQGLMGRYYALAQGENAAVAGAIEDHYKPVGPSDEAPSDPVAITVALADKLDILRGFWSIDEKPTGSKDPYALRRAALGVIRIISENNLRLPLNQFIGDAGDLLSFFHDRLKVNLRDAGARHDLVDAVISEDSDDILQIIARVDALSELLDSEDGQSLLAGYKRATNILVAEEKKDGITYDSDLNHAGLTLSEETVLATAIDLADADVVGKLKNDDFSGAISTLASLKTPVNAFFDTVLVNDTDPNVRINRLKLLARLRETMHKIADFSKISG